MWIYLGGGFGMFVGAVVFLLLSSRIKRMVGNMKSSYSKRKTKESKDYKWTPITTNLPAQKNQYKVSDQMTDSEDEEPIKSTERSKMAEELITKLGSKDDEETSEEYNADNH